MLMTIFTPRVEKGGCFEPFSFNFNNMLTMVISYPHTFLSSVSYFKIFFNETINNKIYFKINLFFIIHKK